MKDSSARAEVLEEVVFVEDEQRNHPPFEEFWKQSRTVQIELEKLEAAPVPDLSGYIVQPLPDGLPKGAAKMGVPLAYLGRRGPIPMWRWVLFALALLFAFTFLATGGVVAILINRGIPLLGGGIIAFVLGIAALNAIIPPRTSTAKRRFWICPHGIIWEDVGKVGFARWDDIHELYDDFKAGMTAMKKGGRWQQVITYKAVYRILLDGKFVTIYLDPSWTDAMKYIWRETSLACFRIALKRIYEGETAGFGVITIDRQGVHANDHLYSWKKIDEVDLAKGTSQGFVFDLDLKNKKTISIDAHGVSLPNTAIAVCRVMIEDTDKVGTEPVKEQEETNPFAI